MRPRSSTEKQPSPHCPSSPAATIPALMFAGARDTLPLILAAIPFGILFGALAHAAGLSFIAGMAMSMIVFAGSSQFVAITLVMTAAPVLIIILATFFVNLRHLMYSAHLVSHVKHLPLPLRSIMAFWLTDETFAVVANRIHQLDSSHSVTHANLHWYYLGSALFMYSNWQLCTLLGFVLGERIPDPLDWGLDIAMVVAFIGVVAPLLKSFPMWLCAVTSFSTALLTSEWPYQSGLMFSMLMGIVVASLSSRKWTPASHKGTKT